MSESQANDEGRRDDAAAQRGVRVAAYRRLAAIRFALEEHEANALASVRWRDDAGVEMRLAAPSVDSAVA